MSHESGSYEPGLSWTFIICNTLNTSFLRADNGRALLRYRQEERKAYENTIVCMHPPKSNDVDQHSSRSHSALYVTLSSRVTQETTLGRLDVSYKQSCLTPLPVVGSITRLGRNPLCDIVWKKGNVSNIPRNAIEIWYHVAGVTNRESFKSVRHGGHRLRKLHDHQKLHKMRAFLRTEATSGIYVNGRKLMRTDGRGALEYARIYSGDTITLSRPHTENHADPKFTCQFWHGKSAELRQKWPRHREMWDTVSSTTTLKLA